MGFSDFEGKTVHSVEQDENHFRITFTDGTSLEIKGRGSDEGCWLVINVN